MKALIIEDENLIAQELMATIQTVSPDIEILTILPDVESSVAWLKSNPQPDLLFMDIKISDGLSFEIFEQVSVSCPVIFCTAYEEYAIKAFKVNGVDYLLKPVQEDDLSAAIQRAKAQQNRSEQLPASGLMGLIDFFTRQQTKKPAYKERFILTSNNRITPIEIKDIALVIKDHLNYFIKFNGEKLIYDYSTLDEIEALLDPDVFFRANRQYIVHINAIKAAKPTGNQKLLLILKEPLKHDIDISREKAPLLRQWMDR
jgi:DNA-binding LytR/AlgR family response regulator